MAAESIPARDVLDASATLPWWLDAFLAILRVMSTDEVLLQQLLAQRETLSSQVREAFLARGAEAVPLLVRVLDDEQLALTDAPGEGYAPIHAARLLMEFGGEQAIRAMVHALTRSEPGEILYDTLIFGLEKLGPAVALPILEFLEATEDAEARRSLFFALSQSSAKDERIFQYLLKLLETDPTSGAMALAEYGDARAIEPLKRAFDVAVLKPEEGFLSAQNVIELKAAIGELGGTLDASQQAKYEQVTAPRRAMTEQFKRLLPPTPPLTRKQLPGRNEPCWCGSGVKYKKCHAASDKAT